MISDTSEHERIKSVREFIGRRFRNIDQTLSYILKSSYSLEISGKVSNWWN